MPKKNKLFPQRLLDARSLAIGTIDNSLSHPDVETEILDKFDTTASQGYTSELTLLSGTLLMPESWDPNAGLELQEAVVDFWLAGIITTDAAAGATSFRVRVDGTQFLIRSIGEANSVTNGQFVLRGEVVLGPSDGGTGVGTGANGSFTLNSTGNLWASGAQVAVDTTSTTGVGISYNGDVVVAVTMQTTDAGTSLAECHGWMRVTYRLPPSRVE